MTSEFDSDLPCSSSMQVIGIEGNSGLCCCAPRYTCDVNQTLLTPLFVVNYSLIVTCVCVCVCVILSSTSNIQVPTPVCTSVLSILEMPS